MAMERHAQKNKLGMHNPAATPMHVADISGKTNAQTFVASMQRRGKVGAIVE
jgi:hypothetical protein